VGDSEVLRNKASDPDDHVLHIVARVTIPVPMSCVVSSTGPRSDLLLRGQSVSHAS
jgi:hypothetical protein